MSEEIVGGTASREVKWKFDAGRLVENVMAVAALKALESGDTSAMVGDDEREALRKIAGLSVGMAALKLRPMAVDFDAGELTITLRLRCEADAAPAFSFVEAAVAERMAGNEQEFLQLMQSARAALMGRRHVIAARYCC